MWEDRENMKKPHKKTQKSHKLNLDFDALQLSWGKCEQKTKRNYKLKLNFKLPQ